MLSNISPARQKVVSEMIDLAMHVDDVTLVVADKAKHSAEPVLAALPLPLSWVELDFWQFSSKSSLWPCYS